MSLSSDQFISSISHVDANSFKNEVERAYAKAEAAKLLARLETPWEKGLDIAWNQPSIAACLKFLVDIELFKKWKDHGSDVMNIEQLARLVSCDRLLLARSLRHLGANNIITETEKETYALTRFSSGLAEPNLSSLINHTFDINVPGFLNLPNYLSKIQYRNPAGPDSSFIDQSPENHSLFSFFTANPSKSQDFQNVMLMINETMADWVDVYPSDELFHNYKTDRPLLVDIGGGTGPALEIVRAKYADCLASGSLVLQDLPEVVERAKVDRSVVTVMAHDFFEPQPLKGARAYYLHIVLHDWPDAQAIAVLRNIVSAMEPGYSTILIHENVVTAEHPHPQMTAFDIAMMSAFSGRERDETTWREIVETAGLVVRKIWRSRASIESVIEAALP